MARSDLLTWFEHINEAKMLRICSGTVAKMTVYSRFRNTVSKSMRAALHGGSGERA